MRPSRPIHIPAPREDDFEDVHWALSAASAMWERGESVEALKWLRRAASTAADRDADVRAVELFKAAADMASIVDVDEALPAGDPPTRKRVSSGEPVDLVPKVPPPTTVSERLAALGMVNESEEDTFIRPETMLRRALMAIDPHYAQRTDYDYDGVGEEPSPRPVPGRILRTSEENAAALVDPHAMPTPQSLDSEELLSDDEPTDPRQQLARPRQAPPAVAAGPMPGGLLTLRVAVLPIPEEGDVRLIFLSPGEEPPPGVATALLVPPSEEDARLLAELYAASDAKL